MTNDFNIMSAFEDFKLTEDIFEADVKGAEEFKDFIDDEEADNTVEVIDIDAEDEEDVKPSYIGDAVIVCPTCHSAFFKTAEEVVVREDEEVVEGEEDIVNVGEECPVCGSVEGFNLVGKVVPYTEVEVSVEEKPEEEEEETEEETKEVVEEGKCKESKCNEEDECKDGKCDGEEDVVEALRVAIARYAKNIVEGIETVSIDDDKTKVTVDVKKDEEEMGIEPVEPEEFVDVKDVEEVVPEEAPEEDAFEDEEDFEDVNITDVEEESLGRAIRKVRPQFESYRVKSIKRKDNSLCVESIARRRDGKIVRESLVLVPHGKRGDKLYFMTEGLRKNKFIVECRLENKNLITESFKREDK